MKIRTECPRKNKYYIRTVTGGLNGAVAGNPTQPYANVLDNCVGYANGRFNESINDPDLEGIVKPFKYQLVCNAENFIESAKRQGLKISSTPIEGGIMVWQKGATLSGGDGAGHVAFVERVYDDGSIMTSESGWNSWAFKTVRRDNSNGRWGQNSLYKFRGCIINPSIENPKVIPVPKLDVDGIGGTCTVRAMQRFFGTPMDGVLSGQNKALNKYYPALKAVEYGKGGSPCVKNLQKWVGTTQDGIIGEQTVKAWQKKLGVACDGIFGANSMRAWQEYLNEHDKAVYPTPSVDYYKVIPVPKLDVDGIGGTCTVRAMQRFFGTVQDGVISGQNKKCSKYYPALSAVEYGSGGSTCVKKMQKWLGIGQDGVWGEQTSKALQKKLGVDADGIFGTKSMKAWQKYLNEHDKAVYPKEPAKVIDVSEFQSAINWNKVKADGIEGAIIRCGYRGYGNGKLVQDERFMDHIKGAHKVGLKVGVYFFTEAINAKEGKEEAAYTLNLVKKAGVPLSYPIAIDTEHINASGVRANNLSRSRRTECIKAFCEEIKSQGYTPMIYGSTSWLNNQLDMSKLPYDVWCAQYYKECQYKGKYVMWQYTSEGRVDGINQVVDMNYCYL